MSLYIALWFGDIILSPIYKGDKALAEEEKGQGVEEKVEEKEEEEERTKMNLQN